MALGVGGVDFYQKALVQLDPGALKSPTMDKVLKTFKHVKDDTDRNAPGRDWNLATAMLIRGEAGMQLMGDWAKGEKDLAQATMSPEFQEVFNLDKGSIPVRLNMKMDKFDDCAKLSANDFVSTAKTGALGPSIAHGMAVLSAVEGAMKDVVTQYWNSEKTTSAEAMDNIVLAARSGK